MATLNIYRMMCHNSCKSRLCCVLQCLPWYDFCENMCVKVSCEMCTVEWDTYKRVCYNTCQNVYYATAPISLWYMSQWMLQSFRLVHRLLQSQANL